MFGKVTGGGGDWFWYPDIHPYLLAAHARERAQGPITVFWKGRTDVPTLRKFVLDSAPQVVGEVSPTVTALIMTKGGPRQAADIWNIPPRLSGGDQLVRFECQPSAERQKAVGAGELIAWARFDEPTPDETESIGVFFDRRMLPDLRKRLAELVSATADHHALVGQLTTALEHLEWDLAEQARTP